MNFKGLHAILICCFVVLMLTEEPLIGTEFHSAVEKNELSNVDKLLNTSPEAINDLDTNHMTPLNLAIHLGKTEIANLLIESGADVTIGDKDNSVPLHLAAIGGHIEIMNLLLNAGASLNFQDNNENTALIHAIANRQSDAALWLIDHGSDISITNSVGDSPLHWAVARHYEKVVSHLIDSGADINKRTNDGRTPLCYSAVMVDTAMARILIEHGADLEIKDNWGRTPLSVTARETGSNDMAKVLLAAGAQVNTADESNDSPLILAAWRGFKALVNTFLDNGASLPSSEDNQRELIIYSASHGIERLFDALVKAGTDINFESGAGGSLLHDAAAGTSVDIVDILLQHDMRINQKDLYGRTPLHYAVERGRGNNVRFLISQGADINARSISGRSPLNLAEEFERKAIIKVLRQNGANPDPIKFPKMTGQYMGQKKPGTMPEVFAPDIVATHNFEHGCITFSPDGQEAFWTSSIQPSDSGYTESYIMHSYIEKGHWTLPKVAEFSSLDMDDVPFFAPDGQRLYFLSRRGPTGVWFIERTGDSWSEPRFVGGGPSESHPYWQISIADNGTMYTASGGEIWVSKLTDNGYGPHEAIGEPITTAGIEGHPCVASNESYLIYQIEDEEDHTISYLYISFKDHEGKWMNPIRLEPGGEPLKGMCPVLSPDGKYLFFNGWRFPTNDIYWVEIGSCIDSLRIELGLEESSL